MASSSIIELPPLSIENDDYCYDHAGSFPTTTTIIRRFRLTLDSTIVELSSLGASITSVLLPSRHDDGPSVVEEEDEEDDDDDLRNHRRLHHDDVVLSYASPLHQLRDGNWPYFGAIVGRVANRIRDGEFRLMQGRRGGAGTDAHDDDIAEVIYSLDRNDGANHLHGGYGGFSNRIWDARIVVPENHDDDRDAKEVRFELTSHDGDQGYPGGVVVVASYSLVRVIVDGKDGGMEEEVGARLRLAMSANLVTGETSSTPVCLAGHSYFNLAGHSSDRRIFDHVLHLPRCSRYTPLDEASIPTREVRRVIGDCSGGGDGDGGMGSAMDFHTTGRTFRDALIKYGTDAVGLDPDEAISNVTSLGDGRARVPECGGRSGSKLVGNAPYGYDHNYVIDGAGVNGDDHDHDNDDDDDDDDDDSAKSVRLVAVLSHPPTRRHLRVYTTAPGLQVYTSNHLDGNTPRPELCKGGSSYGQWQGVCLETQTYPDSIYASDHDIEQDDEFAKGRCFVLRPGGAGYRHVVEYEFVTAV
jgi:aldose 1-epimerase